MAVPQLRLLLAGFPQRGPGLELRSDHVGFVVVEVLLGQVSSEYVGFPCQYLFLETGKEFYRLCIG
jgi:hypothetical protein